MNMNKIVSISPKHIFESPSIDALEAKLGEWYTKSGDSISLFDEKVTMLKEKVAEIDAKFKTENPELVKELEDFRAKSKVLNTKLEKLEARNKQFGIYTYPGMNLIALKSMGKDPVTSIPVAAARIEEIRLKITDLFPVANKKISESVFNDKLLSLRKAIRLYGTKRTKPCLEVVMAGGAATRYLKIFTALSEAIKDITDEKAILEDKAFAELKKNEDFNDIGKLLNNDVLAKILNTPLVHSLNLGIKPNEAGRYLISDIKKLTQAVKEKYAKTPKAMQYAYKINLNGTTVYLNYFTRSYLQTLSRAKKNKSKGNIIYYQLKGQKEIDAMKKTYDALKEIGFIDPAIVDVKFLIDAPAGIPLDQKTGQFIFKGDKLFVQPPGHGAAFIKAGNDVLADQKEAKPFTFRTVENSGYFLDLYSGLGQNAADFENKLRDRLVQILKANDKDAFMKLVKGCKNDIKASRFDKNKSLEELAAQLVNLRWDFTIDKNKTVLEQIENLHVNINYQVEAEPNDVGGGLYVHKDTLNMAVVDKMKMTAEQKKNKDYLMKFNPLHFTFLPKQEMTADLEAGTIFKAEKGVPKFIKGESASTHLATNPKKVLKRIIVVPLKIKRKAFVQHKTINESTASNNSKLTKILTAQLKQRLKDCNKKDPSLITAAQEAGRKAYLA